MLLSDAGMKCSSPHNTLALKVYRPKFSEIASDMESQVYVLRRNLKGDDIIATTQIW